MTSTTISLPQRVSSRVITSVWRVLTVIAIGILLLSIPGYVKGFDLLEFFQTDSSAILASDIIGRLISAVTALFSLVMAFVMYRNRDKHPIALIVAFYLLFHAVLTSGPVQAAVSYWGDYAALVQRVYFPETFTHPVQSLVFATFPDGKFVPRWLKWVFIGFCLCAMTGFWVVGTDAPDWQQNLRMAISLIWNLVLPPLAIAGQIVRYRSYTDQHKRRQLKWFFYGQFLYISVSILIAVLWSWRVQIPPDGPVPWWVVLDSWLFWAGPIIFPISLAIAILYDHLFDIDILINRTIVYASLTAVIVGIYVLLVGSLGSALHLEGNLEISLFATGVVAISFQGLRDRIQRGVNRLMFGQRDEPLRVLERLGRQLKSAVTQEDLLHNAAQTVATTLKVPYAAIYIRQAQADIVQAESGISKTPTVDFPLIYQNERVGTLVIGQRSPGEALSSADQNVLESIAQQMSAVVHSVRLLAELQRSRERLVTAREEERRRLRRDLHDGLGPALASQTLKIDAALDLVGSDPTEARSLLADVKSQSQTLVADVRRLVYELRPPALDEVGLAGALSSGVMQMRAADKGLGITMEIPPTLPELPAAVEVAAYRITMEAVTNVVRHAEAHHCTIKIELHDRPAQLTLIIEDDGKGLPMPVTSGIGLQSMRERSEELGGSFNIGVGEHGGTRVIVTLPIQREWTI
jgi:signal transduction histidine kinase